MARHPQPTQLLATLTDGVVTSSQDGTVWFVPYDYCLRATADQRCVPPELTTADGTFVYGVDAGGRWSRRPGGADPARPGATSPGRLVVRQDGRTVPGQFRARSRSGTALSAVDHRWTWRCPSPGDGRYVFVRPREMLPAGTTDVTGVTSA